MPGPSLVCWLSILSRAASGCASIIEVSTDAQSDAPMWTIRSATNTACCSLQQPIHLYYVLYCMCCNAEVYAL